MNRLFVLNPNISSKKVLVWKDSFMCNDTYVLLMNLDVKIEGFCTETREEKMFMGKMVFSILEFCECDEYVLAVEIGDYDYVVKNFSRYGLDSERLCVWNHNIEKTIVL